MYDISKVSKHIKALHFSTLEEVQKYMKKNGFWQDIPKGKDNDYFYLRDKAAEFETAQKIAQRNATFSKSGTSKPLQYYLAKYIKNTNLK